MYLKKILKTLGLLIIGYALVLLFYKLVYTFPSTGKLFIEKNLAKSVYTAISSCLLLASEFYLYHLTKEDSFGLKVCISLITNMLHGFLYFMVNVAIASFKNNISSAFLEDNAVSMFFMAIIGATFYLIIVFLMPYIKKSRQRNKKY